MSVNIEAVETKLALADMTLHDILAPVREDFRKSGMTEQELDELIDEARKEAWADKQANAAFFKS